MNSTQARTIVITGATSGIGLACATQLAKKANAQNPTILILLGRRFARLKEIQKQLLNKHVKVLIAEVDVQKRKNVEDFIKKFKKELQKTTILINNAGLAAGLEPIQDADINDWEQMIDTNIKGLLYMTRNILPLMIKHGTGHIVNIGSVAGYTTYPNGAVYCATKHAVRALNDAIRIDTLGKNIRVSSIDPGMVETEFSLVRFKGDKRRAEAVYQGLRALHAIDIAEAVLWCLERPAHVNIQNILIMPTDQASVRDVYRK